MLVQTFEDQVRKTPGKIAVKTPGTSLTYEELNTRANRLARYILDKIPRTGGSDHPSVGLLFDHGEHMITAVLAVLKAGKCYVPLSPDYPQKRLTYLLSHSESRLLLTHSPHADRARELASENKIGFLDILDQGIAAFPGENLSREAAGDTGEKSAYIMYTSGSTGHPKGIRQIHENVVYYINNWTRLFSITSSDRMTLFSSFCHDGSGQDMFGALHNGATLYLLNPKDLRADIPLSEFLLKEEITIWHSVPSLYNHFVNTLTGEERFPLLRFILLGGEALRQHEIQVFKKHFPHSTLVNIYGQTESSVNSTWSVRPGDPVEELIIGEPLDNTRIFLIDEEGNAVEPLETGEIIVACPHLSPGYWKDDETTGKFFRHHPELGPLYRTGDLGRLLLNGNIEFIGRKDNQVKIRGFRVELGEIETQLLKHPDIKEAVVRAFETDSNSAGGRDIYLCGYVVCRGGEGGEDGEELRTYLSAHLPDYMVPAVFVQMDRFPLTNSGKVDRKSLPTPELGSGERSVAPRNRLEETLLETWSEVLGTGSNTIGIDDNFFSLGGHSLKAITLASRIHKRLGAKIPLAEMFKNPTIRGFAHYINIQKGTGGDEDMYIPIEAAEEKEYYPLTSAQKRLYLLQRLSPGMTGYNVTTAVEVEGEIDRGKLEAAFRELIRGHDGFRTAFIFTGGVPVQRIHDHVDFEFSDVHGIEDFIRPFDLSKAPLLRAGLMIAGKASPVLLVDMHHIVTDGLSMGIFVNDFVAAYEGEPLPPPRVRYRDYALWQNLQEQEDRRKRQEAYWVEQFAGDLPVVELPLDFPRPPVQAFEGGGTRFAFTEMETAALKELEPRYEVTIFMLLSAGLYVLLSKIGARQPEDIVIGTAVEGRGGADLEGTAGLFVNTLALRNYPVGERSFDEFVRNVRDRVLDAVENQDYPFERLVEKVSVPRDAGRNPLFDVMFTYQETGESQKGIAGLTFTPMPFEIDSSNFDMFLQAFESRGTLSFRLRYCTRLFKEETVRRIAGYFQQVIRSVIEDPGIRLSEIEILPPGEKHRILVEFNRTDTPYPEDQVLHRLFEEQALRTPDRTAVTGRGIRGHRGVTLTYRRLNEMSSSLASLLRRKGVRPGTIVGIMVERTVEMMVGLWAILKSGGAYIPLDPGYPRERTRYVLRHSGTALLVGRPHSTEALPFEGEIIDIADNPGDAVNVPANSAPPPDWAYVIYTSGSTGNPKGVVVRHRSAVNFIKAMTSIIPFSPGKTMLALTTVSFDIFFLETLLPLTLGLTVVIAGEEQANDPALLERLVSRQRVNMVQVTPSRLQLLLNLTGDLRVLAGVGELMVGGEAFPAPLFKRVKESFPGSIYNMYGPTETTIWSTVKDLTGTRPGNLTIGTPIANTRVYIVDRRSRPVPAGVPGELLIGGDGVAAGYLNNPELTAEKFNRSYKSYKTYISYKTGDLARWLPNGEIDFLGRTDHQVKLRGFRIELEEIEEQLMKHEHIREAVVALKTVKSGEKHLCAYFISDNGTGLTAPQLREALSARLPHYMLPSFFIPLEKMPLTPNGKIDRNALPGPGSSPADAHRTYVAPQTGNEKTIARLWKEVLHVENVGLSDNFFDLGGNSMNVIQLNWKLKEAFGIDIPAAIMFRNLSIGFLDRYIRQHGNPEVPGPELERQARQTGALDRARNTYKNTVGKLAARRRVR